MSEPPTIDPLGATNPPPPDERIGKRFGEYQLTARIGAGGMGAVYAAQHVRLGRIAAVKILHGDLARDGKAIQRFATEALTVAKLQHANIVDVYDVGETPEPHCVMELLRGRSLAALLAERNPLPEARILYVAAQVLGVLDLVHGRGITHRDIKPDNIFLVEDEVRSDHVKLLDFGIAKIRDGGSGVSATTGGAMIGTPLYMAPEQIEGGTVDARTDLYAFGLVLYEMVTGRPPFSANTLTSLLSKQLLEVPPAPRTVRPEISPALDAVIVRCIAKKPADRFASASEALQALGVESARKVASRWPIAATPSTSPGKDPQPIGLSSTLGRASGEIAREVRMQSRGPRRIVVVGGVLGALAVGGVLFFAFRATRENPTVVAYPTVPVAPLPSPAQSPTPGPPPNMASATSLLARAAVLLSVGDSRAALQKGREAVLAGAGRDGWILVARAACAANDENAMRDAVAHLAPADAAVATRDCTPAGKPPAPHHAPKHAVRESENGAPIVE